MVGYGSVRNHIGFVLDLQVVAYCSMSEITPNCVSLERFYMTFAFYAYSSYPGLLKRMSAGVPGNLAPSPKFAPPRRGGIFPRKYVPLFGN